MPTSKVTVTSAWQQIATTSQNFILDNTSSYDVFVTFQNSVPDANTAYHILDSGEGIIRMGVVGDLYVRVDGDQTAVVILSV
jgi:hypothetical protein